ncbi:hypothetical protein [Antrihabitans spumae]|uniref:Integral membrane protein n=1 Tax=Antrihabitans spumae TaxID=3373370 RepID=A0ABW7K4M3_9NOCA
MIELNFGAGNDRLLVPVMWLFVAVLVTFVATRLVTRHIRARSTREPSESTTEVESGATTEVFRDINIGGVHIHHQVFGILLMAIVGVALIATTPEGAALNIFSAAFGIGLALTLDEFALWLHLDDVYWSTDGRKSIDAIFCALAITGVLIGGSEFVSGTIGSSGWWLSICYLLIGLAISVVCMLKGKFVTGIVGVMVEPIAIIGALRLAKPDSWWARRRYATKPARMQRARARFGEEYNARWNRMRDLVAGEHGTGTS